jgi:co-chaperonin GroES (HSP10)
LNQVVTSHGERIAAITPLHDRVLVRRLEQPARSGLLWIPDIAQQNSQYAEVIAAGPKAYDVNRGDEVLLPGIAAKYPDWEQSDLMMIQLGDIGGIVTHG